MSEAEAVSTYIRRHCDGLWDSGVGVGDVADGRIT